jgi:dTDP-4-dehydrorhamnose 3,5-epimerase
MGTLTLESEKPRLDIRELEIPDVKLFVPKRFGDVRGCFCETWSERLFRENVANVIFVQDNQSLSVNKGTVRGLHLQKPPAAQGKLVRVLRGSILDVAVDVRRGSPTYKQSVSVKLDAAEGAQLWIPPGFLHGYCTLEDDTEVFYKVTSYYSPSHEVGVLWSDSEINIKWPIEAESAVLSQKDLLNPVLSDLPDFFCYWDERGPTIKEY